MSSVEALSMGLVCLTELVEEYQNFIPDHPFVMVTKKNLEKRILGLTQNKDLLINKKFEGKKWVKKHHGIASVSKSLYSYYKDRSWIK